MYQVIIEETAHKDLNRLPKHEVAQILKACENLMNNPRPYGTQKLAGHSDGYRIREGDYRIIYSIDDKQKIVTAMYARHRKDVYRHLN